MNSSDVFVNVVQPNGNIIEVKDLSFAKKLLNLLYIEADYLGIIDIYIF
jgi:hypothetical protein